MAGDYRFYYNLDRRSLGSKTVRLNSGNYFTVMLQSNFTKKPLEYEGEPNPRRAIISAGAGWGLQRNYAGRFSLDLRAGFGLITGRDNRNAAPGLASVRSTTVALPGSISLGIWLNRREG